MTWKYFFQKLKVYIILEVLGHQLKISYICRLLDNLNLSINKKNKTSKILNIKAAVLFTNTLKCKKNQSSLFELFPFYQFYEFLFL